MWRRVTSLSSLISSSTTSTSNQAAYKLKILAPFSTEISTLAESRVIAREKSPFITFVLESHSHRFMVINCGCPKVCTEYRIKDESSGGPGSGKGTQCERIAESFGFTHLSAGDLLRREISSNSADGAMILSTIEEGKIVPSDVTIKLIQRAMESSDNFKFLIDGFPRTEENRIAFEKIVGAEPDIVLFFDVPEEEMVKRVLSRNQGRVDDNIDTLKKRLAVFTALNLPVIQYYTQKGKLFKINAVGTVDEIFQQVRPIFAECEKASK